MINSYETTPPRHYYGDIVRKLFLISAITMLATLPLKNQIVATNFFIIIIIALGLTILAGFTSPQKRLVTIADIIVSIIAFILFELAAAQTFSIEHTILTPIFLIQQALAIAFLIALYFSSKTLRGTPKP